MSEPTLFDKQYWKRPTPAKELGDEGAATIYAAVGHALTQWEGMEEEFARLFLHLSDAKSPIGFNAVRRAYGAIESNLGRRKAIEAAAEVYFLYTHAKDETKKRFSDLVRVVGWASLRRNDIAHAIVISLGMNSRQLGSFLLPPDYNTERTSIFYGNSPNQYLRAEYRYTTSDIDELALKFRELAKEVTAFLYSLNPQTIGVGEPGQPGQSGGGS